jgi:hypothetical protein
VNCTNNVSVLQTPPPRSMASIPKDPPKAPKKGRPQGSYGRQQNKRDEAQERQKARSQDSFRCWWVAHWDYHAPFGHLFPELTNE